MLPFSSFSAGGRLPFDLGIREFTKQGLESNFELAVYEGSKSLFKLLLQHTQLSYDN